MDGQFFKRCAKTSLGEHMGGSELTPSLRPLSELDLWSLLYGSQVFEASNKHKRIYGSITALHPASARSGLEIPGAHCRDETAETLTKEWGRPRDTLHKW